MSINEKKKAKNIQKTNFRQSIVANSLCLFTSKSICLKSKQREQPLGEETLPTHLEQYTLENGLLQATV
jgi:hypothetical protein